MATKQPDQMPPVEAPAAPVLEKSLGAVPQSVVGTAVPQSVVEAAVPKTVVETSVPQALPAGGSSGSAAAIAAWSENLTVSVVIFVVITLIFVGITFLIFSFSNLAELTKNFAKYRCNPLMMPFAGQFGYDAKENFSFCVANILNNKAAEIFAPLYGILSQFTGILTVMMNATLGIRKLFSNFFLSINSFIGNVRNRIQNLLFEIRMSFLKLNNLMGRVFGTMFAVIFMGSAALTTGNNLSQTDLVKFLGEFCFDPETPVKMVDGLHKPIKEIQVGDRVMGPNGSQPRVTSAFVFDGSRTEMVRINDVSVSAQHYVEHGGKWIQAQDHPDAVSTPSLPTIHCLNVFGNTFFVGNTDLMVRDYDETENPGVTSQVMDLALKILNGARNTESGKGPLLDYDLGFDQRLPVYLADGSAVPAEEVKLGTVLEGGHKVVGIVHEACREVVNINGFMFSTAQLLHFKGAWHRAGVLMPQRRIKIDFQLINFVTENSGPIVVSVGGAKLHLRDYREVALPEMEEPYADYLEGISCGITCP